MNNQLITFATDIKNIFISTDFLKDSEKAVLINQGWNLDNVPIKLESGKYIDPRICNNITNNFTFRHTKTLRYKNIDIDYAFYDKKYNLRYARFYLGYLCFLINLLDSFSPLTKSLKIILINCDFKKYIPDDEIFKSFNVNSGLTYCYSDEYAEITIYRQEEMAKVLTHEMIHFYSIDSKYVYGEERLNKFFCMNGKDVNVNEAFTETLACLINIVLYTILQNKSELLFQQTLLHNLQLEQLYSRAQAHKVLKIAKFTKECNNMNNETTHAISYYVIKSILINNAEDFLYYLRQNNFRLKDKIDFVGFVIDKLNNIDLLTFGKQEYDLQKDKKTMRMTILDTVELMKKRKVYKDKSNP